MLLIHSLGSEEFGYKETEYSRNTFESTLYNTENVFWKLIQDLEYVYHYQISDLGKML